MTALLYLLNTVCAAGQSALGKRYAARGGDADIFNISKALSGTVIFLLLGCIGGMSLHLPTVIYAVVYGIFLYISMRAGFYALALGPLALTSIIASFSLLIPFMWGITVFQEPLSAVGGCGIGLLLIAVVLLQLKRESSCSVRWFLYAAATMVANGICSLVQKYHQLAYPQQYTTEFMLFSLLTVSVILTAVQLGKKAHFSLCPTGLISGVMNGTANGIVLYLAATENASVLFPIVSVLNIITTWVLGRTVFKEKLKPLQMLGFLLGIASVILLKL